jgi:hypothetical protein
VNAKTFCIWKNILTLALGLGLLVSSIADAVVRPPSVPAVMTGAFLDQALIEPPTQFRQSPRIGRLTTLAMEAGVSIIHAHVAASDLAYRVVNRFGLQSHLEGWRKLRFHLGLWVYQHSPLRWIVAMEGIENLVLPHGAIIAGNHINQFGVDGFLTNPLMILITGRWLTFVVDNDIRDPMTKAFLALLVRHGLAISTRGIHTLGDIRRNIRSPKHIPSEKGLTAQIIRFVNLGRLVVVYPVGFGGALKSERGWHLPFAYAAYKASNGLHGSPPVFASAVSSQTKFPTKAPLLKVLYWLKRNYPYFRIGLPAMKIIFSPPQRVDQGGEKELEVQKLYQSMLIFIRQHTQGLMRPEPISQFLSRHA